MAATHLRAAFLNRLLVVNGPSRQPWSDHTIDALPELLHPGDLLVVNDAATLPASLSGTLRGLSVELRLTGPIEEGWGILFGAGSWRLPTEHRVAPPHASAGDVLSLGDGGEPLRILEVDPRHPRRIRVALRPATVWAHGRPIQYSYHSRDLALSEVQTPYATRPWAVEMPSAGRPLTAELMRRLRAAGVLVCALTHAAGLSSTGSVALDAALPFPERYEVPRATWRAVQQAPRVIAVGTSVVRALESAARGPLHGITELTLTPQSQLRVVDGLLSGMHEPGEPHFRMMGAFADPERLRRASAHAARCGYRNHEFGDSTLLFAEGSPPR
ncbi:MAG: S-adenosylmethionine:tRNA ribosyltransferase-isomerase [Myxococcales bacterium]|nr:S-adenosylmethionine:tRNA ribosyltransferase-isomerase [Myxococcales bacterium]